MIINYDRFWGFLFEVRTLANRPNLGRKEFLDLLFVQIKGDYFYLLFFHSSSSSLLRKFNINSILFTRIILIGLLIMEIMFIGQVSQQKTGQQSKSTIVWFLSLPSRQKKTTVKDRKSNNQMVDDFISNF